MSENNFKNNSNLINSESSRGKKYAYPQCPESLECFNPAACRAESLLAGYTRCIAKECTEIAKEMEKTRKSNN